MLASLASLIGILPLALALPLTDTIDVTTSTEAFYTKDVSWTHVTNAHIFDPPAWWASWRVVYHRAAELRDGSLLSTWENYKPEPPLEAAPIWRSTNGGKSFSKYSEVKDQVNGWGMRYQPNLYVLPRAFGGLKEGDVLFAGNSVPANLSATKIDLYASTDGGYTWEFLSNIAMGGVATAANGYGAIWEPFLELYNGKLICHYSDQRDPLHSQKLVHQRTKDLRHWDAVVEDVAWPSYNARPGMTTVDKMPNGNWIMTYEVCGVVSYCPVYFRVAPSPLLFASSPDQILNSTDGVNPNSAPYVKWVPNGGANGTVIANGADAEIFVNTDLAEPGTPWTRINVFTDGAHARTIVPLSDGDSLLLAGGGQFQDGPVPNNITYSIISLSSIGIGNGPTFSR